MIRNFNNKQVLAILVIGTLFAGCSSSSSDDDLVGNWSKRSDFDGAARSEAASFSLDDKGYVYGGFNGTKRYNDLWEYNASQNFWTQKASLDTVVVGGVKTPVAARNSASAFSAAGKGYVGLGYDGSDYLSDFYQYDPTANKWTRIQDFKGTARINAVAFGLYDQGYVGTGYDGNYLKDFWKYDPTANTWSQIISLGGTKRQLATAFVVDDKAYICCGTNNGSYVTDFWRFDPKESTGDAQIPYGKWTELKTLKDDSDDSYDDDYSGIPRSSAVAFVVNKKAYLATGESGSLLTSVWEYNTLTDRWVEKTAFEGSSRMSAVGFTAGGKGFVATGRSSSYRFDDMWEFKPDDEYDENN